MRGDDGGEILGGEGGLDVCKVLLAVLVDLEGGEGAVGGLWAGVDDEAVLEVRGGAGGLDVAEAGEHADEQRHALLHLGLQRAAHLEPLLQVVHPDVAHEDLAPSLHQVRRVGLSRRERLSLLHSTCLF